MISEEKKEAKRIRARELYQINKESILARKKAWAVANPEKVKAIKARVRSKSEIVERERAKHREWLANNADHVREYRKKYRSNPEKKLQEKNYRAEWRIKKASDITVMKRNERAKKRNAPGSHTLEDVEYLFLMQKGKCAICKRCLLENGKHVDHVIPLSLNGSNDKLNLQLLCPSCNLSKHNKHPVDFMQSRGYLL